MSGQDIRQFQFLILNSTCRYLKQNARKSSKVSNITETARGSLETWLEADKKLYDHFLLKINAQIDRSDLKELN